MNKAVGFIPGKETCPQHQKNPVDFHNCPHTFLMNVTSTHAPANAHAVIAKAPGHVIAAEQIVSCPHDAATTLDTALTPDAPMLMLPVYVNDVTQIVPPVFIGVRFPYTVNE